MKKKKYEKKEGITFLIIGLILIESIGIILLFTKKEYTYEKISGIIVKDDKVLLVTNSNNRKILYKNKRIIIGNKEQNYSILDDHGVIYKKDKMKYSELLIKVKTPKKMKSNDVIEMSMKIEKKKLIELLKTVWEGD